MQSVLLGVVCFLLATPVLAHGVSEDAKARMLNGNNWDFMWLGAEHMVTGYDHLLFLFGVMFFLSRFTDILKFVTAFTLGHTVTLVAATYLQITANYFLIDAIIACTVMYKAFENLDGFKKYFDRAAPNLVMMVFLFGLIHGFGLSTRLQEITISQDPRLLGRILSFNVGVELGQIAALTAILVVLKLLHRVMDEAHLTKVVNGTLMIAGTFLLFFQLHGYIHMAEAAAEAEHAHEEAVAVQETAMPEPEAPKAMPGHN